MPIQNHPNHHVKNISNRPHTTSTLPISYYANPSFPYASKLYSTRSMMMNSSFNGTAKLPIAIVPPFAK